MTQEEMDELNKEADEEAEAQRQYDYDEYMKERFAGIDLHKRLKI